MEDTKASVEALYEKAQEYLNTNIELAKLKTLDKSADLISTLVPRLLVILFILMFVFTANIALSLWIGALLGKNYYGFALVALFYVLVALIIHFVLHKNMKKNIRDLIINSILT